MKLSLVNLAIILTLVEAFAIFFPTQTHESREYLSLEEIGRRIKALKRKTKSTEEHLKNIMKLMDAAGISTPLTNNGKGDGKDNESLSAISSLLGETNAKVIAYIASIAESINSGNEDSPKKKDAASILEHIATVLKAQPEGFEYGKIEEFVKPPNLSQCIEALYKPLKCSPNRYYSSYRLVSQGIAGPRDTKVIASLVPHARYASSINQTRGRLIRRPHMGLVIVPQQTVYVVERFGKYNRTIGAGMHILIPGIERISYIHSLKEDAIVLPNQTAITKDNVILQIDGVLYVKCVDPYHASYGIEDAIFAMTQMAQTTMRSELGKLSLDTTFLERDNLNQKIVEAINAAAANWGMICMRYEIRDITLPKTIVAAMERQVEAERSKRASILRSEGDKESEINLAISKRQIEILKAEGEAIAERERADATAYALQKITNTLKESGTIDAVSLRLAEKYIAAFANLAKQSNTVILPTNVTGVNDIVLQAMALFKSLTKENLKDTPPDLQNMMPIISENLGGSSNTRDL